MSELIVFNHSRAELYDWETVLASDPTEWLNAEPLAITQPDGRVLLFPESICVERGTRAI